MIRTNVVQLSTIDGVAFRQKLQKGGSGVTILRYDTKQPGIASISKTSGEPIPAKNTPLKLFPKVAFEEAIVLTNGMPYKKQKPVKLDKKKVVEDKIVEEVIEEEVVVDSAEYEKIVKKYTNKQGKLSYDLINKDFIKFAHSSKIVRDMIDERKPVKRIRLYIVGNKFRNITGNDDLTDKQVQKIVELLDEVSPKAVFKELDDDIKKALHVSKRK